MNGKQQTPHTTGQKVMTWVLGRMGKQVGQGECWDLAEYALKQAGALTSNDLGPVDKDSDYIWGSSVDLKDIIPGDILQLRDHKVTINTEKKYVFSDGSWQVETQFETAERPHHTAIANGKLDGNDGSLNTIEQHVKPLGKVVQHKKLYTRDVAPVVTKTTERRINPDTKKVELSVAVTKTVTITVTGTIWAYRPAKK